MSHTPTAAAEFGVLISAEDYCANGFWPGFKWQLGKGPPQQAAFAVQRERSPGARQQVWVWEGVGVARRESNAAYEGGVKQAGLCMERGAT